MEGLDTIKKRDIQIKILFNKLGVMTGGADAIGADAIEALRDALSQDESSRQIEEGNNQIQAIIATLHRQRNDLHGQLRGVPGGVPGGILQPLPPLPPSSPGVGRADILSLRDQMGQLQRQIQKQQTDMQVNNLQNQLDQHKQHNTNLNLKMFQMQHYMALGRYMNPLFSQHYLQAAHNKKIQRGGSYSTSNFKIPMEKQDSFLLTKLVNLAGLNNSKLNKNIKYLKMIEQSNLHTEKIEQVRLQIGQKICNFFF